MDNINHGIKSSSSSSSSLHQTFLNINTNNKYVHENYEHDDDNGVGLDVVYMPRSNDKNMFSTNSFKAKANDDEKHKQEKQRVPDLKSEIGAATPPSTPTIDANSRFKWRPTSMRDFGLVKCKATNEIGSTECSYELKLGGVPNPPTDCTHVLKNTSAIISCQVGFHQVRREEEALEKKNIWEKFFKNKLKLKKG